MVQLDSTPFWEQVLGFLADRHREITSMISSTQHKAGTKEHDCSWLLMQAKRRNFVSGKKEINWSQQEKSPASKCRQWDEFGSSVWRRWQFSLTNQWNINQGLTCGDKMYPLHCWTFNYIAFWFEKSDDSLSRLAALRISQSFCWQPSWLRVRSRIMWGLLRDNWTPPGQDLDKFVRLWTTVGVWGSLTIQLKYLSLGILCVVFFITMFLLIKVVCLYFLFSLILFSPCDLFFSHWKQVPGE